MRSVYKLFSACLAVLVLGAVGCGSDDSNDGSAATTATTGADAGLVGEWSTENVCEDQVRAFKRAGLDDELVREWTVGAEYPGHVPRSSDPCHGAKPAERTHSFGKNGSFASYDQNGHQVDHDSYVTVDDGTFILAEPGLTVHYRIEGDEATFKVVLPDCTTDRCEHTNAYVTSVFFPQVYERTGG